MSRKKKVRPASRTPTNNEEKRRQFSRRAILAALGLGAASLPTLRASEPAPTPTPDADREFENYWKDVKSYIAERDKTKDPKEKEKLELSIQFLRREVMKTIDRSHFAPGCLAATPTPGPGGAKPK